MLRESDRGERAAVVPANELAQRSSDRRSPGRCTIECRIVCTTRVSVTSEIREDICCVVALHGFREETKSESRGNESLFVPKPPAT